MRKLAGIICLIGLGACTKAHNGSAGGRHAPQLEQAYPALAWVPADATYVVTGKTSDLALALREIVTPASMMPIPGLYDIENQMRMAMGTSFLDARDLSRIGIAVDGSAAIYSTGVLPTIVLPVEDGIELQTFLDANRPETNVRLREKDGVQIVSWEPSPDVALVYARVDKWLLVHIADRTVDSADAWLDAARKTFAGDGIAHAPDLVNAAKAARAGLPSKRSGPPSVLGLLRVAKLMDTLGGAVECATAVRQAVESITLGIDIDLRSGDGLIAIEMSPEAASALRQHTAEGPPPGYWSYRADAGLYGDFAMDLDWFDQALVGHGCWSPSRELAPVRYALRQWGARGAHVAVKQLQLDELRVQAAAYASLSDRRPIDRALDQIPGRSFLERNVTIGGRKLKSIDLGVVPRFVYQLTGTDAIVAVGDSSIESVFAANGESVFEANGESVFAANGQPAPEGLMLGALGTRPEKMPDLADALGTIYEQIGYDRSMAKRFVDDILSRYADAGISFSLVGDTIEFRGWMRLAP
jgi:hypothetical protein